VTSNKSAALDAASHKIRFSIGEKNLGKVTNKSATWSKLVARMSEPLVDIRHTLEQYLKLDVNRQSQLKNVGFFVGGHCDKGVRRVGSIKERWLITLDVDECNPGHVFDLEAGMTGLTDFEFFVYSTRKHTTEKPRIRIIIPLAEPCDADSYHALTRIVGERFDPTMESIDPVSYRATQLMYWPSVCKDAEFFTFHNRGALLKPAEILEAFGDWQDHTKLPRSERDDSQHVAAGKKPEDPETKEGLVGAFCQTYDVISAIDTFLSDIYIDPVETHQGVRYTYSNGTTSHGAIVYDDGKFLYSNHMHDPASGHSQNAFDLVRIHKFGELDVKAKEGTTPLSMPSVKAMLEFLDDDKSVKKALRDQNYDLASFLRADVDDEDAFDELGDPEDDDDLAGSPGRGQVTDENWIDHLDLNSDGLIKSTMHNAVLILMFDPRLKMTVRKNAFSTRKVYHRKLDLSDFRCESPSLLDPVNGGDWTDSHTRFVKMVLESPRGKNKPGYGLRLTKEDLNDSIDLAAERQQFHPVREYLKSLKWDGKKRMARVFVEYLGAVDNQYHREVCRLTLLAAVTRIFEPGHKFDYMPILEGVQGKRKSQFVEVLAKSWFREMGDFEDRNRAIECMSGAWILEFGELQQFNRADVQKIKAFLSNKSETTRLAYDRNPRTFLRQCIFIGTTNESEYLRDTTGNRRFWPVYCTIESINIDKLRKNIDQIWAEAYEMYTAMRDEQPHGELPLYLVDKNLESFANEMQESRKILSNEEILADQIETWLNKPCSKDQLKGVFTSDDDDAWDDNPQKFVRMVTCATEIYEKVLGMERKKIATDKSTQYLIAKAMTLISGWERSKEQGHYGDYGKQKVLYHRVPQNSDDEL